jgi:predicted dehydrogenase
MDLMTKETQIITMGDEAVENSFEVDSYRGKKYISIQNPVIPDVNALREEIQSFCKSIVNNTETEVKLEDGLRALTLVDSIVKQIEAEQ